MGRPTELKNCSSWIICVIILLSGVYNSADSPSPRISPVESPTRSSDLPPLSPQSSSRPRKFLEHPGPVSSKPHGVLSASAEAPHHSSSLSHGPLTAPVSSPIHAPPFRHDHPLKRFTPSPPPSTSPSNSPSYTKSPAASPFPLLNPVAPPVPARSHHFPPTPIQRTGPSASPAVSPSSSVGAPESPSPVGGQSPAPTSSPSAPEGVPESSPVAAPSPSPVDGQKPSPSPIPSAPVAQPARMFLPPPPNLCELIPPCQDPYTNPLLGSPCACVLPMKVKLRLSVALYLFFPLVSELAREIGDGVFMDQTQVHIMGANAAIEQPDKTIVLVDLVPRGLRFDHASAMLTFERFWRKQVDLNAAHFGNYDVLYVQYPGLPESPPLPDMMGDLGGRGKPGTQEPFGVDVHKRREREKLGAGIIAVSVLSSVLAVTLCAGAAWFLVLKLKRRGSTRLPLLPARHALTLPRVKRALGMGGAGGPALLSNVPDSASGSLSSYTGGPKTFSLGEMERATGNFDESRVVGEGGFGRVYQGMLEDGTLVAVKVLKRVDQRGGREFLAEIEMLSRLHHRNLVKLIGLCAEDNIRGLVYELIPNGSVESHLHGVDKDVAPLDWATRVKIALGSARALSYLHEDSNPPVIHRDFKSSNILLDQNFTPKVSDFGLARAALNEQGKNHISTRVVGTFGYVAPEYALTGHLLVKSDVYSYGVVLLELLTGRKPVDMSQPPGQENLVAWAHPLLTKKEDLEAIIDPSLGSDLLFDSVAKVAAIASMCVQPEVTQRPSMGEVVQALKLVSDGDDSSRGREEFERCLSAEEMEAEILKHNPVSGSPEYK